MEMHFGINIFIVIQFLWNFAVSQTPQPNVISDGKRNGLFLWIYLKPKSDIRPVLRLAANLHNKHVADLQASNGGGTDNEILAGVGFGTTLYGQAKNSSDRIFRLANRSGALGSLPYTGGDLFIHAKCNNLGLLFELSQIVKEQLSSSGGNTAKAIVLQAGFEDTYGFVYKNGRDLSGFIDGTENPVGNIRQSVTVDSNGGSYCITQKWIHNMDFIKQQSVPYLEGVIGRRMNDSGELDPKPATSHVARMTSGPQYKAPKPVQMYRQSMPWGTVGQMSGLFFIGFANDPNTFDYFLNRMVSNNENKTDDVMRISLCQSGNYWYFPSMEELQKFGTLATFGGTNSSTTTNTTINNNNKDGGGPSILPFKPEKDDEMARKTAFNLDTGQQTMLNCRKSNLFKSSSSSSNNANALNRVNPKHFFIVPLFLLFSMWVE